jgi:cytochrome c oxidase assembly factor CtaG
MTLMTFHYLEHLTVIIVVLSVSGNPNSMIVTIVTRYSCERLVWHSDNRYTNWLR